MRKPKLAIGIDLGSSKCCVGVVRDGKVEILENERGNKTTPSYVAFTDTERLVGEDAKDQATLNPVNTVTAVKRIIGRQFDDPAVQELLPCLPYKLFKSVQGKPILELAYLKRTLELYPEQVTAMLLTKMVEMAKKQLDFPVEEAVISVPASFSNAQRQATKDAAAIAGLKVLALINEPTAAAIAYQANRRTTHEENIAVVDYGGGKIEVSFYSVGKGSVEVRAVHGCNRVGGIDVDHRLVELLMKKFWLKWKIDLKGDVKAKERLRNACEKLKHTLSLLPEARVQLDCLSGDVDFEATVTRKEFDDILAASVTILMDELWRRIEYSLKRRQLTVSKVLLVGGSTRIPAAQEWLKDRFGVGKLDKTINPDEAVAEGAAIRAALLCGRCDQPEVLVADAIPNPLYLTFDNTKYLLFDRFTNLSANLVCPLSVQSSKTSFILSEEQSSINGVSKLILAEFVLPRGSFHSIKFRSEVDESGILIASMLLNGKEESLQDLILESLRLLSSDDLSSLVEQEKQFREEAKAENKRVMALSELEAYCFKQKNLLEALGKQGRVLGNSQRCLEGQIEEAINWVDNNPGAAEEELELKMDELQLACSILEHRERASSRSSSVGRSLAPPGVAASQERPSRRDQARPGGDAPKARAASQAARPSGRGPSGGVFGGYEGTNGRGISSRGVERESRKKGESPQRRAKDDQSGREKYPEGHISQSQTVDGSQNQASERSRRQSPRRQTAKRSHSGEVSPPRQLPPRPRGESPQRLTEGSEHSVSRDSQHSGGTPSNQRSGLKGDLPLSSTIIKGFTENQSNRNGSNSPTPIIKQPLMPTSTSRQPLVRIQSGTDNKQPLQSLKTPRESGTIQERDFRPQSSDRDGASSQSSSLSYQVNMASPSQCNNRVHTDQVLSTHGHGDTSPSQSTYSPVYQSKSYGQEVSSTGSHQTRNILSSNSSHPSSHKTTAAEQTTSASPLETDADSDLHAKQRCYGTRSLGTQTDFPNTAVNASKPITDRTCGVCCEVLRCRCSRVNGPIGSATSRAVKESNAEPKSSGSMHQRAVLTTVPPVSRPFTAKACDGVQAPAPRHYAAPVAVTSHATSISVSLSYATPTASPITTRSTQPTYTSSATAAASRGPPRHLSSVRVHVPVSSMCSHVDLVSDCNYCNTRRSKEMHDKPVAYRTSSEGRRYDSAAYANCCCGKVTCPICYARLQPRTGLRTSSVLPESAKKSVKDLRNVFEPRGDIFETHV